MTDKRMDGIGEPKLNIVMLEERMTEVIRSGIGAMSNEMLGLTGAFVRTTGMKLKA